MRSKTKNRIRRSTKLICVTLAIFLLLISVFSFYFNLTHDKKETEIRTIYTYTDLFKYKYLVNLKDNEYVGKRKLEDNSLVYVNDLVDNIEFDTNYKFIGSSLSNINYSYSIVGEFIVNYTVNGNLENLWKSKEVIDEKNNLSVYSTDLNLNKKIVVDLKDKNEIMKKFELDNGMSVDAKYLINININVDTEVDGKKVVTTKNIPINIDLSDRVCKITGNDNYSDSGKIDKDFEVVIGKRWGAMTFNLVLMIIAVAILRFISKSSVVLTVRNDFKVELNKLLKANSDKIVQVSDPPVDLDGQEVFYVKDFDELFKIADEMFKPILYYCDYENQEAYFTVVNDNSKYRYIFRK